MIILGNKYQITKEEEKKLLKNVNSIYYIDINGLSDKEIIKEIKKYIDNIECIVLNLEKNISIHLKAFLEELDYNNTQIMLFSEFCKKFLNREIVEFNENNILLYEKFKKYRLNQIIKRLFDIIFSIFAIIFTLPIMIIIAIFIKIKSPNGPIFFIQERLGLNGKLFKVYKFRTMVPDAEEKLKELLEGNPKLKEIYLKYRKLKDDPRIILGIGSFLRKTSLDELPQFFNVLFGDMSVVGPRPYIKEEFYNHDPKFLEIILSVKPGITGLWQVGERNNTTFNERVYQDIEYIVNQSLKLDIKIIIQTVLVMVVKKGAY